MDDLIVFSDKKYHAHYLAFVIKILNKHNVGARPVKCDLGRERISFVGHYVDGQGLHVDPAKITAITDMPYPSDKAGIRRFLGMCGYLRRFIPQFGANTIHLTDLLGKDLTFSATWSKEHEREVDWLKQQLVSPPVLAFPDWSKEFIVRTDASKLGLGCTISQIHGGIRRPIAYFSRKTVGAERTSYGVRDLECLAVQWGCRKCREYVQGSHFTLETDHSNLLYLKQATPDQRRLYNYACELSALNFTLKHVAGESLHDADCLSRNAIDATEADGPYEQQDDPALQLGVAMPTPQRSAAIKPLDRASQLPCEYPVQPTAVGHYNVFLLGYGACTDAMAVAGTTFKIIGGCETDKLAETHFENRTGAPNFGGISQLIEKLETGLLLPPVHVMAGTMPCRGRSRLSRLNRHKPPPDDTHLFEQQLRVVELVKPTVFYAEMVEPCAGDNEGTSASERLDGDMAVVASYTSFEQKLYALGYDVTTKIVRFSEHGDYTDRRRYICVATRPLPNVEFAMPLPQSSFPGLANILDPPGDVAPSLRANAYEPSVTPRHEDCFSALRLGTVTRGRNGSAACDTLHNRLHDIKHPLPVITSHFSWSGTNGGQWILDEQGPRQLSLQEQARAHNFDAEGTAFLLNMAKDTAQGFLARSLPVGFLTQLYESIHGYLQSATAIDNSPTPRAQQVAPIQPIPFPKLDVIIAAQRADPELREMFTFLENDKKPELHPRGRYQRFAYAMRLHKGALFYREELGTAEILVDAVVVPKALTKQIMSAVHDSHQYFHPGRLATEQIICQQAFWIDMKADIRKHVLNCADCKKAKIAKRTHAGKTKRSLVCRHHQRFAIDFLGPFVEVEGFKYVCHVTDVATGLNYAICLPNKEALTVGKALTEQIFLKHGLPEELISDNGTEFINKVIKGITAAYGVKHIRSSPYHPKGNAFVENRHRHYNAVLKIACNKFGMSWPTAIHFANWALNVRPYRGTHVSPYELMYAQAPPTMAELAFSDFEYDEQVVLPPDEFMKNARLHMANITSIVEQAKIDTMRSNAAAEAPRYTVKHATGSLVLVKSPVQKKGETRRLLYQYIGPFEVIGPAYKGKTDGDCNVYRLRHLATGKLATYNIDLISPYISVEAHVQLEEQKKTNQASQGIESLENNEFDPQPGAFLLFPNFGNVKYHLVQVVRAASADGELAFKYYNTSDKLRLKRFLPVWTHPTKMEVQAKAKPKGNKDAPYTLEEHSANLEVFCQMEIPVDRDGKAGKGVHLNPKEVKRVLQYVALESY